MEKKSRLLVLILLLLFVFDYASSNFFSHTHTIDGVKVVHSHPYSSDKHSHSRSALDAIAYFNRMLYLAASLLIMPFIISVFNCVIRFGVKVFITSFYSTHRVPRAPPTL